MSQLLSKYVATVAIADNQNFNELIVGFIKSLTIQVFYHLMPIM